VRERRTGEERRKLSTRRRNTYNMCVCVCVCVYIDIIPRSVRSLINYSQEKSGRSIPLVCRRERVCASVRSYVPNNVAGAGPKRILNTRRPPPRPPRPRNPSGEHDCSNPRAAACVRTNDAPRPCTPSEYAIYS